MKRQNVLILSNAVIWAVVIFALATVFAGIPEFDRMIVIVGGGAAASMLIVAGGLRKL